MDYQGQGRSRSWRLNDVAALPTERQNKHKWIRQDASQEAAQPALAKSAAPPGESRRPGPVKSKYTWRAPSKTSLPSQNDAQSKSEVTKAVSAKSGSAACTMPVLELQKRLTGGAQQTSADLRPSLHEATDPSSPKDVPGSSRGPAAVQQDLPSNEASTPGCKKASVPRYTLKRKHQLLRLSSVPPKVKQKQGQEPNTDVQSMCQAIPFSRHSSQPETKNPAVSSAINKESETAKGNPQGAAPPSKAMPQASAKLPFSKTPLGFTRKGKHSLVRKTSIVSAAAKTMAAVRSSRIVAKKSMQWTRVSTSKASQPTQSSQLPRPNKEASQASQSQGKSHSAAFRWTREGTEATKRPQATVKSISASRIRKQSRQMSIAGQARAIRRNVASNLRSSKLLRVNGTLYKVKGAGSGRSLKRQSLSNTALPTPTSPKRKVLYKRKGNALHRLLSGSPVSTLTASRAPGSVFRGTRIKASTPSGLVRKIATASSRFLKQPAQHKTGLVARIRKATTFVNQLCKEFCRTGKCLAKEKGQCKRIHDPAKIAVCPHWLTQQCSNPDCRLQHVRQEDLMPTCIHFLRGACSTQNCPYLHVNLDKDAPTCPEFLDGYCPKGKSCRKKHITKWMLQDMLKRRKVSSLAKKSAHAGESHKKDSGRKATRTREPASTEVKELATDRGSNLMLPAFLRGPG